MRRTRAGAALLAGWFLAGCGGVISKEVRRDATPVESFGQLREAIESYRGKTVILAGEILETRNRPDGTTLAVLEKPADRSHRPRSIDVTGGRFLARFGYYLDPAVYARGRRITVAGRVTGVENEKVGEAPYTYVVLEGREAYLWRDGYEVPPPWYDRNIFYPYPLWYDPFWGHRPWP